ncbi:hypothetical protein [Arthrobacter sp. NPDC058192]|uniref:hypothetical protein n=1 Tax=Arthrobacter sp. NPDC058192 TaxID=3346372 RepID=UPI0036E06FA0
MTNDYAPFRITGVNTATMGVPTNDGSPGSALYAVPLTLSRPLSNFEQQAMVAVWDAPPSSTTMHRPGTARCYMDSFVLSSTTVEEVRDYHLQTLTGVVAKVNELSERNHREAIQRHDAEAARLVEHKKNVEDVAKGLSF